MKTVTDKTRTQICSKERVEKNIDIANIDIESLDLSCLDREKTPEEVEEENIKMKELEKRLEPFSTKPDGYFYFP